MARQTIIPGGAIEAVTAEELRELFAELQTPSSAVEERVRGGENVALDAGGSGALEVYQVPPGMEFRLTRVVVSIAGFTFAAPIVAAGASVEVRRNGRVVDGINGGAGLPNVLTNSHDPAPVYRNGENVEVAFSGWAAAANATALAEIEGDLYPMRKNPAA